MNQIKKIGVVSLLLLLLFSFGACKKGKGINIFTVEQDKQLGAQLRDELAANPTEYTILPFTGNEQAYNYLYNVRDEILNTTVIKYRTRFDWELYIIDDEVLNAFCAPGGYMYFYTGIIKFLEEADHLAGVMGHEIAHADQRHSTQQMTQVYGLEVLLSIIAGDNPGALAQVAAGLVALSFSRNHEKDADDHSVDYLCETSYAANGAAAFFQKLIDQGQSGSTPAFLSTHPNPDNRVQAISTRANEKGCSTALKEAAGYAAFKALLP